MTPSHRSRLHNALLCLLSPLLEKNILKTAAVGAPIVFSMARVVVLAFAVAHVHRIWRTGVAGWPDATLATAIVLALPIVNALDRAKPADVLALITTLIDHQHDT